VTTSHAAVALLAAVLGGAVTIALISVGIDRAPRRLERVNVSGRQVPAVLGLVLAVGTVVAAVAVLGLDYAHWDAASSERVTLAVLLLAVVAGGAGVFDDLRGEEPASGFRGHLAAAGRGRITGGLIKILGIGLAGVGAGFLLGDGRFVIECALAVALSANLFNLLDRAPGRALKVGLVAAIPLVIGAPGAWLVASGGMLGGALACLPADLSEKAMLGDAGSNVIGAILGLGLALAVSETALLVALVVLAGLNLASERWSFSEVISRTPPLAAFDSLGRRGQKEPE
jgi:UDP-N-acetylmuramyl pentapeptide phosphotransferase/UDP-N-acetylglucosamine-1-phosphate transferase